MTPDGYGPSIHTIIITMNVEDTSESIYNKSIYIYIIMFNLNGWVVGWLGWLGCRVVGYIK